MKSGWKDFFYFQQNDKRAILLLLILFVCCIIAVLLSDRIVSGKEIALQQESLDEFENFQNSLTDKQAILPVSSQVPRQEKNEKSPVSGKLNEGEKIDLNGADIATIKRIPGIGDSFAKRIYDYHDQLGGFVSPEQLMEIEGISPKRYEKILPYIELKKKHKKLVVNNLSALQLSSHPYITDNQAQSIVILREKKRLMQIKDLSELKDFSPRDIDRLSDYISFD